jgi:predicted ATPase
MSGSLLPGAEEGLYIKGPVGTGKTTLATEHLQARLGRRVPARKILIFLPQRALAENDHVGPIYPLKFRSICDIRRSQILM